MSKGIKEFMDALEGFPLATLATIDKMSDKEWRQHGQMLKKLRGALRVLLREVEDEIKWMDDEKRTRN